MRTRKLVVAMTLGALLGSDVAFVVARALAEASGVGNGQRMMPPLGGGDGAYGRMLPGPGMTAPYAVPQLPFPSAPPQGPQRAVGPTPVNVCQPGGSSRPFQTVSVPRTRPVEPLPQIQQQP